MEYNHGASLKWSFLGAAIGLAIGSALAFAQTAGIPEAAIMIPFTLAGAGIARTFHKDHGYEGEFSADVEDALIKYGTLVPTVLVLLSHASAFTLPVFMASFALTGAVIGTYGLIKDTYEVLSHRDNGPTDKNSGPDIESGPNQEIVRFII